MIALRTSLNGQQLSLAGAEDLCVLNSIVNAVGKLGPLSNPRHDSDEAPKLTISVGGLTGRADSDDEHLYWTEHQELSIGDEISITVVETEETDSPTMKADVRPVLEEHERQRFENARKTYFELRHKYEPDSETNGS